MKDEKAWDFTLCLIGSPCKICIKKCTFRLDKDADEKENENERTTKRNEIRN